MSKPTEADMAKARDLLPDSVRYEYAGYVAQAIADARAEEREACARLVIDVAALYDGNASEYMHGSQTALAMIARTIRAGGEK